jgi:hypothetical protein
LPDRSSFTTIISSCVPAANVKEPPMARDIVYQNQIKSALRGRKRKLIKIIIDNNQAFTFLI